MSSLPDVLSVLGGLTQKSATTVTRLPFFSLRKLHNVAVSDACKSVFATFPAPPVQMFWLNPPKTDKPSRFVAESFCESEFDADEVMSKCCESADKL